MMLYLLHFDRPLGRARHYLGCTTEARLHTRLREHAAGKGASLTRAVFARAIPVYLARIFPQLSYDDERRIKNGGNLRNYCPLCCPLLERLKRDAYLIDPSPAAQTPTRAIWDYRPPLDFPPKQ